MRYFNFPNPPRRETPPRWSAALRSVTAVVIVGLVAAACSSSGSDEANVVPDEPFEWLDGSGEGEFAEFAGTPLVVNFFQSTCAPCVAEMPDFQEVSQAQTGQVAFMGMNTQDIVEEGLDLVERTGVTYPNGRDATGELWSHFGGLAMPLTAFVDTDGGIVHSHNGPLDIDSLNALIQEHLQ